jgi:hypothetical protein
MTKVREYFKQKFDKKNNPTFMQGVLRTLKEPHDDPSDKHPISEEEVVEK